MREGEQQGLEVSADPSRADRSGILSGGHDDERSAPGDAAVAVAPRHAQLRVGNVAGQLARLFGASRVIGSAGGPTKARRAVTDFGFDAVIDYTAEDVAGQLARYAPEGIDLYVDLVGGEHLDAALGALRTGGRVAIVGAISDSTPSRGPGNFHRALPHRLSLRGMIVSDHLDRHAEYVERAATWLNEGTLRTATTVVDGLENAPEAFLSLFRGANTGKLLVRLADE